MSKNSRQKRTAKRKLALALLAQSRNPPMVATKGHVRSVWSKAMPAVDMSKPGKSSRLEPRWSPLDGSGKVGKSVKGNFVPKPKHAFKADGILVKHLPDVEPVQVETLEEEIRAYSRQAGPRANPTIPNSTLARERSRAVARLRKREE